MGNLFCAEKRDKEEPTSKDDGQPAYPQQNLFTFDELTIDSRMECGNLMLAEKVFPGYYNLWIAPDNYKTEHESKAKVWFLFSVSQVDLGGQPTRTVTFKIKNMNTHELGNYKNGMVPVYSAASTKGQWQYIPGKVSEISSKDGNLEFAFPFEFNEADSKNGVQFAFTFPYTYTDSINFSNYLEQVYGYDKDIYFHRELLANSLDGRRIELFTITHHDPTIFNNRDKVFEVEPYINNLFPERDTSASLTLINKNKHRPFIFKGKGYIFLTCRVHPCETPASHMIQSFMLSLLNKNDPVSAALLSKYVFVIIPMLNPDGVARGHYRTDTLGRDLNRVYHKLSHKEHPGPYAAMEVAKSLGNGRIVMYIDLHAHSTKDSGFVFGNYQSELVPQTEIRAFARLFDIYSKYFDFNSCGFGKPVNAEKAEKVEKAEKAEKAGPKKQGIGKTEIGKAINVIHCYTLEAGYCRSMKDPDRYDPKANPKEDLKRKAATKLTMNEFYEIGHNLRQAIAEYFGVHPQSILPKTIYKDITALKAKIYDGLSKNDPSMQPDEEPNEND